MANHLSTVREIGTFSKIVPLSYLSTPHNCGSPISRIGGAGGQRAEGSATASHTKGFTQHTAHSTQHTHKLSYRCRCGRLDVWIPAPVSKEGRNDPAISVASPTASRAHGTCVHFLSCPLSSSFSQKMVIWGTRIETTSLRQPA
ncbi:unnamed protein product [Chondrus crispus]|uniref:Uncharacterized protein n=1 Tax=Chondrus crispus TaxID=2769 RepID=R7QKP8_CHOCR|nr:unnamed protein product [Chondrus crispus]CDF38041.1 unnamed protein product [Chondrus crispus]|eukprot:XP_005717910.1 unnamed protein product [Chondrus crispus]